MSCITAQTRDTSPRRGYASAYICVYAMHTKIHTRCKITKKKQHVQIFLKKKQIFFYFAAKKSRFARKQLFFVALGVLGILGCLDGLDYSQRT